MEFGWIHKMSTMDKDRRFGTMLGTIMGIIGITCFLILFLWLYEDIIRVEIERNNGCGPIIVYFYPVFTDLGVISGILWLMSALGFMNRKEWAFNVAVIANVLSLKASFWPNIPAMESHASPPFWFIIFLLNLFVYFILLRKIGKIPWYKILLGLGMGMCFILSFINGIAATQRMVFLEIPERTIYIMTERINIITSIGWGACIFGLLLTRREWVKWFSIGSAILGVIAGFPVAIASAMGKAAFSMFFASPVLSLLLLLIFLWPKTWEKIMKSESK
jgi:hypothetical protein